MKPHNKKTLIIEDHPLNLKLFRDVLRARGYDTVEDRTGRDCLALAEKHLPNLIIMDVLLPFSSGIELARQLKANPETKNIPILGVTALAISETHDKMIEAGCVDCLTKPFTLDQLLARIEDCLNAANDPENPQERPSEKRSLSHYLSQEEQGVSEQRAQQLF